ncbi:MAG: hypothetical protein OXN17_15525, partial [Candidatus Poribacteria bacterium]|nr:hypothetical protein [Candidatus Poribacteria bacterium]
SSRKDYLSNCLVFGGNYRDNHLQGLTNENRGVLQIAISNTLTAFVKAENKRIKLIRPQMEIAAYDICDGIDPQFIFQRCGRFEATPNAPNN